MPSPPPQPDDLPTPDQLRASAAKLREDARRLIIEAEIRERLAVEIERAAHGLRGHGPVTPQEAGSIGGRLRRLRQGPVYDWLDSEHATALPPAGTRKTGAWLAPQCGVSYATLKAMLAGKQGSQRSVVYASKPVMKAVEVLSRGWIRKGERRPRPLVADDWPHPEP